MIHVPTVGRRRNHDAYAWIWDADSPPVNPLMMMLLLLPPSPSALRMTIFYLPAAGRNSTYRRDRAVH